VNRVKPRFGVLLLQNVPAMVLIDRARRAEAMGFDQVWVGDHFVNPYAPGQDWFDGWSILAALAVSTSRVRLGPLVSSVTLHNPARLARTAMTVDHLSGGRLELGIGPGGAPLDYAMTGLPVWPPGERVERLEETLDILESLLERGSVDHTGPHYRIEGAVVAPPPVQRPRPPITVGALGRRAIGIAARHAEGWNTYGVAVGRDVRGALDHAGAVDATRRRVALLDEACVAAGRDPASIRRSYLSFQGITQPILEPNAFLDFVGDFQEAGIDDFIVYWPDGEEAEHRLTALVDLAFPTLRG
jgi:alkanesulfonate monooxygenase SsuD/methylene tetrahydromethanopterin reductase-like flavin-dependent oxidoreductase (luciferase family)